jgi:SAM-dependent methyltransferase
VSAWRRGGQGRAGRDRQCLEYRSPYLREAPPFGVPRTVAAVSAADWVLDAGCGSARLTLALVEGGAAAVVGIDSGLECVAQGRARLFGASVAHVTLMEADFDHVPPFSDGRFGAPAPDPRSCSPIEGGPTMTEPANDPADAIPAVGSLRIDQERLVQLWSVTPREPCR